jgi:hypothetical protein
MVLTKRRDLNRRGLGQNQSNIKRRNALKDKNPPSKTEVGAVTAKEE